MAILLEKIRRAVQQYGAQAILIGGGVSANSVLRRRVAELATQLKRPLFIPPMKYCTDNAAMVAGLAYPLLCAGKTADLSLEAVATV